MIAASAKSFLDVYKEHPEVINMDNMTKLGIGSIVAFMVALVAVKFFITYLQKHGFKVFGIYRIVLGIAVLIMVSKGIIK